MEQNQIKFKQNPPQKQIYFASIWVFDNKQHENNSDKLANIF